MYIAGFASSTIHVAAAHGVIGGLRFNTDGVTTALGVLWVDDANFQFNGAAFSDVTLIIALAQARRRGRWLLCDDANTLARNSDTVGSGESTTRKIASLVGTAIAIAKTSLCSDAGTLLKTLLLTGGRARCITVGGRR